MKRWSDRYPDWPDVMKIQTAKLYPKIVLLILCICNCSGCWDRKELKTQAIVAAEGVDRSPGRAGKYLYSFQIIKPGEVANPKGKGGPGGSGEAPVWVGESEGRTPFEAGRNIAFKMSRRVFLAHEQAFIIGKDAARQGVRPIIDLALRNYQTRLFTPILIAKGIAKDVFTVPDGLEKVPAFNITGMLTGSKYTSEVIPVTLEDFFGYLISKTRAPVAPLIEVYRSVNVKEKRLRLSGTAVFKKDRWIGELNQVETRGLLWALGQFKRGVVNIPAPSGAVTAAAEIIAAGSRIRPEIRQRRIVIRMRIDAEGNLQDILVPDGLTTPEKMNEKLHELEKGVNAVIRREIRAAWYQARRLNADIFGFGEAVRRSYPRRWNSLEPRWDRIFPGVTLQIEVHTVLSRVGEIVEPEIPLTK